MARKGRSSSLKRLASPAFWPIPRKEYRWVSNPSPGSHSRQRSFPLLIVLRDILGVVSNRKEAKLILEEKKIKVDNSPAFNLNQPLSLMDTVEILPLKTTYRVLPHPARKLILHHIPDKEKLFKLCRIEDKTTQSGGVSVLHLHDGRNMREKIDVKGNQQESFTTFDVLKISLKDKSVQEHFKFAEKAYAIIVNGQNVGKHGSIVTINRESPVHEPLVKIALGDGTESVTRASYVFVIGNDKPAISLSTT